MLVLHLRGPVMAFGAVSVDETVPVADFPPLSMVTGLLANALGHTRASPRATENLQENLLYAVRIERCGTLFEDFQTAQLRVNDSGWTTRGRRAGRTGGPETYESPNVIRRDYRADAAVTLVMSLADAGMEAEVEAALRHPARPLFLGRANCFPAVPVLVGRTEGSDVLVALEDTSAQVDDAPDICPGRWPAHLGADRRSHLVYAHDVKDWQRRLHTERRAVRDGQVACPRKSL